jgi:hypothetical protein
VKTYLCAAAFVAVAAAAAGCGGHNASRCENVPRWIVSGINESLNSGVSVRGLQAVRSSAFDRGWLVSGDLEGPGLEGNDDYATWASNGVDRGNGTIQSADSAADEFSALAPLPYGFADDLDGYDESHDCVRAQVG